MLIGKQKGWSSSHHLCIHEVFLVTCVSLCWVSIHLLEGLSTGLCVLPVRHIGERITGSVLVQLWTDWWQTAKWTLECLGTQNLDVCIIQDHHFWHINGFSKITPTKCNSLRRSSLLQSNIFCGDRVYSLFSSTNQYIWCTVQCTYRYV